MLTILESTFMRYNENEVPVYRYTMVGLSTDEKPTTEDVGNGSAILEMDTSTVVLFDEDGRQWRSWE